MGYLTIIGDKLKKRKECETVNSELSTIYYINV